MGIASILIHSFADFNLHIPVNSLWFIVLMAFAWVAGYADEGVRETRGHPARVDP